MLEAAEKADNSFWTLTYADSNLRRTMSGLSTLAPEDARNFMKRIRWEWAAECDRQRIGSCPIGSSGMTSRTSNPETKRLRFYLVGEYGDKSERPHYHLALFGFPRCRNLVTLRHRGRPVADQCCFFCRMVHRTWGVGDVDGGGVEEGSAKYLLGYVLKKMTRYDDLRLGDRNPEFARMSLRPGIGQRAMHEIASTFMALGLDQSEADVPSALRRGPKLYPLGRYLKQQLRLMIGKEVTTPEEIKREMEEKMRPLREIADMAPTPELRRLAFKNAVIDHFAQEILNRKRKSEIFKSRGSL